MGRKESNQTKDPSTTEISQVPALLQRVDRMLKFSYEASLGRETKALIRLRGYAGWSATLLLACNKARFSHITVHMESYHEIMAYLQLV